jgi:hypothetical protein
MTFMTKNKRAAITLIIGLMGLLQLMRKDRFELFHTVDVLQLLVSGACFGVAITMLLQSRRSSFGG